VILRAMAGDASMAKPPDAGDLLFPSPRPNPPHHPDNARALQ
jgi:hypothetical protein